MDALNNQKSRSRAFCRRLAAIILAFVWCCFAETAARCSTVISTLNPSYDWTVASDSPWIEETNVTHNGISALQVGPLPTERSIGSSQFQTTVSGPAVVSFWAKLSRYASLAFTTNTYGNSLFVRSPVDWTNISVTIGYGEQTLTWSASLMGDSSMYLAEVTVTPITPVAPSITNQPISQTVLPHQSVTLSVASDGSPGFNYQWYFNGTAIYYAQGSNYNIADSRFSNAGTYTCVVQNLFGSTTSAPAVLNVQSISLDQSLDEPTLHWTQGSTDTSVDAQWFGQTNVSIAYGSAAESSWSGSGNTWLETTVTGPCRLGWFAKLNIPFYDWSGQENLSLLVDDSVAATYSGNINWSQGGALVPFGQHTVKWNHHPSIYGGDAYVDGMSVWLLSGDPPTITAQPQSTTIPAGEDGMLQVSATGTNTGLFSCGWLFNGRMIASGTQLSFTHITPLQAGNYVAVISNLYGVVTTAQAYVSVPEQITLRQALDAPELTWKTSPDAPWFGETAVSHDGQGAAQSCGTEDSWLETTVVGPGVLSFRIRNDSTAAQPTVVNFTDNDILMTSYASGYAEWALQELAFSSGPHRVRFSVQPNANTNQAGPWMDNVQFTPGRLSRPTIISQAADQTLVVGRNAKFFVTVSSTFPVTYQWSQDGFPIDGATDSTLIVHSVDATSAGVYTCVVNNGAGTTSASMKLIQASAIESALGTAAAQWQTDPGAPWRVDTSVSRDGAAVRSAAVDAGESSCLSMGVMGPGKLTFWWKVSSKPGSGLLTCSVDDYTELVTITGEKDWRPQTVDIPPGWQTVSWCYEKYSSISQGHDCGWIDSVSFVAEQPLQVRLTPERQTVIEGGRATFTADCSGDGPFTYFWNVNGVDLLGVTNRTLVLNRTTSASAGTYSVTVSTPYEQLSAEATLQIRPAIEGQRVVNGSPVQFRLKLPMPPSVTTYWVDPTGPTLNSDKGVSGATGPVLTIDKNHVALFDGTYFLTQSYLGSAFYWSPEFSGVLRVKASRTVVGWGFDDSANEISAPDNLDHIAQISVGTNGSLLSIDDSGLLNQGSVFGNEAIAAVASGTDFVLGLKSDGTVIGFGNAQLPDGLSDVTAISACESHALALRGDGTVVAWGSNDNGESSVPDDVMNVTAISAGTAHSIALKADGTVVGWGNDDFGQLVIPSTAQHIKAIAAGGNHNLALRRDGTVVAWGDNSYGQCNVPTGLQNIIAIAAGANHSVALKRDGTVVTWGGVEASDGTIASATVPQGLKHVVAIAAGGNATYALIYAPVLTGPPTVTLLGDGTALLSIDARCHGSRSYQWRVNGKNIPGAISSNLDVNQPATSAASARTKYDVVVRDGWGTATSDAVMVPVFAAPIGGGGIVPVLPGSGGLVDIQIGNFPPPPPLPMAQIVPIAPTNVDLRIGRDGDQFVISWSDMPGLVLESTDNLTKGFSTEPTMPETNAGRKSLRISPNTAQRFYRLRH